MTPAAVPDSILVAVDFSPASLRALDAAYTWAQGAEITVLHVIDTDLARRAEDAGVATKAEAIARMRTQAERNLAVLARDENRSFESMIVEGSPFLEILRIAEDLDFGMILIGRAGAAGGVEQVLFGSTAEKVVRAARRPVLCVP